MNYADAINSLRPDCAWSWNKIDYSGIVWHESNKSPIPSKEELEEEIARLEAEHAATQYQRDRKAEYDQLNQYEMMFDDEVNGTTTWIDAINAIKAKYPKPE